MFSLFLSLFLLLFFISYPSSVSLLPPTVAASSSLSSSSSSSSFSDSSLFVFPSRLSFGPCSTLIPVVDSLDLVNPLDRAVDLTQVIARNNQFQISALPTNRLPAHSRIKLSVTYLARSPGVHSGELVIRSSAGDLFVVVEGEAKRNKYQVEAIGEIVLPVGLPITPPIYVHNPFDRPLLVKEVLTTEPFLQLRLPSEQTQSGKMAKLWEIPPHKTKFLLNLAFTPHRLGHFSGLVHLKTDRDLIVLPVSIRVVADAVAAQPADLKFGTITHKQQVKTKTITIHNYGLKPIMIANIRAERPDPRLHLTYTKGLIIPPRTKVSTVAVISYSGSISTNDEEVHGKLLIYTNQTRNSLFEVPYRGRVLYGSLSYNKKATLFSMWRKPEDSELARMPVPSSSASPHSLNVLTVVERVIELTNRFAVALTVEQVTLEREDAGFTILEGNYTRIALPGEKFIACRVRFDARLDRVVGSGKAQPYAVELKIKTNLTTLQLPLRVFSGQLSVNNFPIEANYRHSNNLHLRSSPAPLVRADSEDEEEDSEEGINEPPKVTWQRRLLGDVHQTGQLDFGRVRVGESRRHIITLTNNNPIDMAVHKPQSSADNVRVCFLKQSLSESSWSSLLGVNVSSLNSSHFHPFPSSLPSSPSSPDATRLTRVYTRLPISIIPTSADYEHTHLPASPQFSSSSFLAHAVQRGSRLLSWSESVDFEGIKQTRTAANEATEEEDEEEEEEEEATDEDDDAFMALKPSYSDSSSLCDPEPSMFLAPGESLALFFSLHVPQPSMSATATASALPAYASRDRLRQALRDGVELTAATPAGGQEFPVETASVSVDTDIEDKAIALDISYQATSGELIIEPEAIIFPPSFPGLIVNQSIFISHSFPHPLSIFPILSPDPSIVPSLIASRVPSGARVLIGHVAFDASLAADAMARRLRVQWTMEKGHNSERNKHTLIGEKEADSATEEWPAVDEPLDEALRLFTGGEETPAAALARTRLNALIESDLVAVRLANVAYQRLHRESGGVYSYSLQLVTDVARPYYLTVTAPIVRPKLASNASVDFGLVPQETRKALFLHVENPSDSPVQFQLLPPVRARHWPVAADELSDPLFPLAFEEMLDELDNGPSFTNQSAALNRVFISQYGEGAQSAIVVEPHSRGRLGPILFQPQLAGTYRAFLLVRNNLTRIEAVGLTGQSGCGFVAFKAPASVSMSRAKRARQAAQPALEALHLNLTAHLLAHPDYLDIYLQRVSYSQTHADALLPVSGQHALRLAFAAVNTGQTAIQVRGLLLSAHASSPPHSPHHLTKVDRDSHDACRLSVNHGLLVDGCEMLPATIRPGESVTLVLVYSPTAFRLPRPLHLVALTSWGDYSVPIEVTAPDSLESTQTPLLSREKESANMLGQLIVALLRSFLIVCLLLFVFAVSAVVLLANTGQLTSEHVRQRLAAANKPTLSQLFERIAPFVFPVKQTTAHDSEAATPAVEEAKAPQVRRQRSGKKKQSDRPDKAEKAEEKDKSPPPVTQADEAPALTVATNGDGLQPTDSVALSAPHSPAVVRRFSSSGSSPSLSPHSPSPRSRSHSSPRSPALESPARAHSPAATRALPPSASPLIRLESEESINRKIADSEANQEESNKNTTDAKENENTEATPPATSSISDESAASSASSILSQFRASDSSTRLSSVAAPARAFQPSWISEARENASKQSGGPINSKPAAQSQPQPQSQSDRRRPASIRPSPAVRSGAMEIPKARAPVRKEENIIRIYPLEMKMPTNKPEEQPDAPAPAPAAAADSPSPSSSPIAILPSLSSSAPSFPPSLFSASGALPALQRQTRDDTGIINFNNTTNNNNTTNPIIQPLGSTLFSSSSSLLSSHLPSRALSHSLDYPSSFSHFSPSAPAPLGVQAINSPPGQPRSLAEDAQSPVIAMGLPNRRVIVTDAYQNNEPITFSSHYSRPAALPQPIAPSFASSSSSSSSLFPGAVTSSVLSVLSSDTDADDFADLANYEFEPSQSEQDEAMEEAAAQLAQSRSIYSTNNNINNVHQSNYRQDEQYSWPASQLHSQSPSLINPTYYHPSSSSVHSASSSSSAPSSASAAILAATATLNHLNAQMTDFKPTGTFQANTLDNINANTAAIANNNNGAGAGAVSPTSVPVNANQSIYDVLGLSAAARGERTNQENNNGTNQYR